MNKSLLLSIFALCLSLTIQAQKLQKVKGNRTITTERTTIEPFHTIVVGENLNVEIIYNKEPSVEVVTDENLHEFIVFEVTDSILTFRTTRKVTSKKKMEIKVMHDENLQHIEAIESGEITSLVPIDIENGSLSATDNSKAELTIKANNFEIINNERARIKLNLTATNTSLQLRGNSRIEALINSPKVKVDAYERAVAVIEGDSDSVTLEMDNNSKFNGKNFTTQTCNVNCSISGDVTIEVIDTISIDASGNSSISLYENPKIIINSFTDTAKLQKKVK